MTHVVGKADIYNTLLQVSFDPDVMHVFEHFGLPAINPFWLFQNIMI